MAKFWTRRFRNGPLLPWWEPGEGQELRKVGADGVTDSPEVSDSGLDIRSSLREEAVARLGSVRLDK